MPDKEDFKIMTHLDKNCRITSSKLALKMGLSKQAINKRIKNLKKEGFIIDYFTLVDYFKLGFNNLNLFLKLEGLSTEENEKVIHELKNHRHTGWVSELFGEYDIGISLFYKKTNEIEDSLNFIHSLISTKIVAEKQIVITKNIIPSIIFRDLDITEIRNYHNFSSGVSQIELNNLDRKIISLLNTNSRVSFATLSKSLTITPNAVKYRIKQLEKLGVIGGYKTLLNYNKLGFLWYLVFIETFPGSDLNSLIQEIKEHHSTVFISQTLDKGLMVDFIAKDVFELKRNLNYFKNKFYKVVRKYPTMNVIKIHKLKPLIDLDAGRE